MIFVFGYLGECLGVLDVVHCLDQSNGEYDMTVGDAVNKLLEFDQDLPFCVADWSEEYMSPSEPNAENMFVKDGHYITNHVKDGRRTVEGKFLRVG